MSKRKDRKEGKERKKRLPTEVDMYVWRAIRRVRLQRGLSQKEVATELGMDDQSFSRYERGDVKVRAALIYDIAVVLAVSVGDLYPPQSYEKRRQQRRHLDAIVKRRKKESKGKQGYHGPQYGRYFGEKKDQKDRKNKSRSD